MTLAARQISDSGAVRPSSAREISPTSRSRDTAPVQLLRPYVHRERSKQERPDYVEPFDVDSDWEERA